MIKDKLICFGFVLPFAFITMANAQQSGWTNQQSGTTGSLNDVFFVEPGIGTIVGTSGTILKTTNAGAEWRSQPSGTTSSLNGVFFHNVNAGIAVGQGGTILSTANGGEDWRQQASGTTNFLRAVFFTTPDTGFVAGSQGTILKTTNGGLSWTSQQSGTTSTLMAVYFIDDKNGFAVGTGGTILRTTNGGESWASITSGVSNNLNSISFSNMQTGVIVGDGGIILRTINRGLNWTNRGLGGTTSYYKVHFSTVDTGTVVGAAGTILRTTDGGQTWIPQRVNDSNTLSAVFFTSPRNGTAVGSRGTILHTTNGGEFTYTPKFQRFLDRVNSASVQEKAAIVDSFIAAAPSFPYVEQDTCAYFIYRGNAASVSVVLIHWVENFPRLPLTKIPDTNLWYGYATYETDARIEYMLSVNGGWMFDPLNPLRVHLPAELGGDHSELAMPAYVQPPEIKYYPDIPHGTLHDTTFYSAKLNNSRIIKVYTPPFYRPDHGQRYPVALIHDGLWYVNDLYADNVLDYLIAEKKIRPIIAVFIPAVSLAGRSDEYLGNRYGQFTAFIFEEVLPFIDQTYATQTDAASRAMIGASDGGHISVDLCNKYPQQFGLCGAVSGGDPGYVRGSKKNIKYYLDWGTYEPSWWTQPIKNLRDMLLNQGYQVKWKEWHEGHTIGHYRAHLDEALEFFFSPGNVTAVDGEASMPVQFHLAQNYPNPFSTEGRSPAKGGGNPGTTISYDLPQSIHVKLVIYDVLGHEVRRLVDESQAAGHHQIAWDGQNGFGSRVPSGLYFYRMTTGEFEMTRKLMVMR